MVLQCFVGALIFVLVTLASGKPQMKQSYHENTNYGNDGGNLPFSMTQCIWENQYYDIGAAWTKPGECKVYSCEMGSAIIQKVHQPAPNLKWRM
ncbi:unnamed protein product, partial [Timema podura]|nr:unnamed protein product [Timema podura]